MINWKQVTTWLVLAFVVGFGLMLSCESKADDSAYTLAPGSVFVGGDRVDGFLLGIRETVMDGKIELGLNIASVDGTMTGGVQAQRCVGSDFKLCLGAAYWAAQTPAWNSNFSFALSARYEFDKHWAVDYGHWSTGGITKSNSGLDALMVRYSF